MERQAVVTWEKRGASAVVTLNDPPVNILTEALRDELFSCMDEIRNDAAVKSVIITGKGEKAFMAGANIKGFPAMIKQPGAAYGFAKTIYDLWDMVERFPKPTIAAINGLALGAGLELALVCDIRIAEEHASFGFPEIKLGLFPGGGGTQRLPRLVGIGVTKELCLLGESISAERAYSTGLVSRVVPRGESLNASLETADRLNGFSGVILDCAKQAINGGIGVSEAEGLAVEADLWQKAFMTDDADEGIDAFIHKRAAVFHDK